MAWGWACRFAARLSRHMMAGYGLSPTHPRAPSFSLSCSLTLRFLLVVHDESNRSVVPGSCRLMAARFGPRTMSVLRAQWGGNRTYRGQLISAANDPGCVKTSCLL